MASLHVSILRHASVHHTLGIGPMIRDLKRLMAFFLQRYTGRVVLLV